MATEQYLDDNGLLYYHNRLKQLFATKAEAGDENTIETVKVNGSALTPDAQKAVNVAVPTSVAQLTDGSDYATKAYVDNAIGGITGVAFEVVQSLPASGNAGTIYLVPNSGTNPNIYDEYIWVSSGSSGSWEKIGTTDVDLSGYVQKSELGTISNATIDAILAGTYSG